MNQLPNVYGIILASGLSRRMGKQKLLLPWGKDTIFDQVIRTVKKSKLQEIYVVIPYVDRERKKITDFHDIYPVLNENPSLGMGSSLSLAIKSLPEKADAVMVLLADQPEIHSEDINVGYDYFCKQYTLKRSKVIIQTNYQNGKKGHPILFSKHFFKELSSLYGDVGGKQIIKAHSDFVTHTKSKNNYPQDIDTPADYTRLVYKRHEHSW